MKMLQREVIMCHHQLIYYLLLIQMNIAVCEVWVNPMNDQRYQKGEFYHLCPDLRHYPKRFFHMYWMSVEQFDNLLERLEPLLRKKGSNFRVPISPEQQLVLTLT